MTRYVLSEKLFAVEDFGQTRGKGHYLAIYRADRQPVEIVAVTEGSREMLS